MDGLAVVTADEMKRLEKIAVDAGENEQRSMENAGSAIAQEVENFLGVSGSITLLIGKGNKGEMLLQQGRSFSKRDFLSKPFTCSL